jgi:hypothetical protein
MTNPPDSTESSISVDKESTPLFLKGKSVPELLICKGPHGGYLSHKLGTWDECKSCSDWQREHDPETIILENVMRTGIQLDPNDKFDKVIIEMVEMNRKKRRDYAADSDIFSNFRDVAGNLGMDAFGPAEAAYVLLLTKIARLRSLRINGRMSDPSNESVLDTFLDLAVYATLVLGLVKEAADDDGNA